MDKFRIDSHKLIYHPDRVNDWLKGGDVYPIYVEVSPAGACNHRCTYCALDYMEYQMRFLDTEKLCERLTEMGRLGIKSIMYAGEGEPLLHKDIIRIINHTKASGIDVAITSNGVPFTKKVIDEALASITWIKISFNAGTRDTYASIHRTKPEDFDRVVENISYAVKTRKERGLDSTIGMQMVMLPENTSEAVTLAKLAKSIGADYLVIKPYSQHHKSKTREYEDLTYSEYLGIEKELAELNDENFNVVFRADTMKKLEDADRHYKKCEAIPFWSYMDAGGGLWACSAYLGDDRFHLGNALEDGFEKVWKGEKRKKLMEYVKNDLDTECCRVNCRMDAVNRYLWELKHPQAHVNFI